MEVPATILQDMVAYIEQSNNLLEKTASVESEVAQRAPNVVDALIKAGFLLPEQRQQAIIKVQDPLKALESLRKTAEASQAKAPVIQKNDSLGSSGEIKTAGVSGRQTTSVQKESDQIWNRAFGFNN